MSNLLELLDHVSGETESQHIFLIRQLKLLEETFAGRGCQLLNCSFRRRTGTVS
jgi:hypothetical protein